MYVTSFYYIKPILRKQSIYVTFIDKGKKLKSKKIITRKVFIFELKLHRVE